MLFKDNIYIYSYIYIMCILTIADIKTFLTLADIASYLKQVQQENKKSRQTDEHYNEQKKTDEQRPKIIINVDVPHDETIVNIKSNVQTTKKY